jgi:hypothetical protein
MAIQTATRDLLSVKTCFGCWVTPSSRMQRCCLVTTTSSSAPGQAQAARLCLHSLLDSVDVVNLLAAYGKQFSGVCSLPPSIGGPPAAATVMCQHMLQFERPRGSVPHPYVCDASSTALIKIICIVCVCSSSGASAYSSDRERAVAMQPPRYPLC